MPEMCCMNCSVCEYGSHVYVDGSTFQATDSDACRMCSCLVGSNYMYYYLQTDFYALLDQ